jgi:hypothetical protein
VTRRAGLGVTAAALAVLRRPGLWPTAIRQGIVLAPDRWWTRRPYLPLPDRRYLRFRLVTQYGDPDHPPVPGDVVDYLTWCRQMRRMGRT